MRSPVLRVLAIDMTAVLQCRDGERRRPSRSSTVWPTVGIMLARTRITLQSNRATHNLKVYHYDATV